MNYLDLLPNDIAVYIYDIVNKSYYLAINKHLFDVYHCHLDLLNKAFKKPSIAYIFTMYTGKSIEELYTTLLLFNFKNKYPLSVKESISVLNKHIKKNIRLS